MKKVEENGLVTKSSNWSEMSLGWPITQIQIHKYTNTFWSRDLSPGVLRRGAPGVSRRSTMVLKPCICVFVYLCICICVFGHPRLISDQLELFVTSPFSSTFLLGHSKWPKKCWKHFPIEQVLFYISPPNRCGTQNHFFRLWTRGGPVGEKTEKNWQMSV